MKIEVVCAYLNECLVLFKCEHCGHEERGYVEMTPDYMDDILPNLHCELCRKSSLDNANQAE